MPAVVTTLKGAIALLPIMAQAPLREALAWKTDVMSSKSGLEDRETVRGNPRQTFQMTLPANAGQTQAALNALWGALRFSQWGIPVWPEAQLIGAVASGLTTLPAEVDLYDFRDASLALLYQSPTQYQVLEIDTVGVGALNLLATTQLFTRALLMPLRVGRVQGGFEKRTNGYTNEFTATFAVDDNRGWDPAAPEQFLGNDIYYEVPLLSGETLNDDIDQESEVADFELGPVAVRTPWENPRTVRPHRFLAQGAQEVRTFKDFLNRRRGRFRSFWAPSFEADARPLSTGTVTTSLVIAADDYQTWSQRRHIAVQTTSGVWMPRTILDSDFLDPEHVELTLDTSLGIPAETISHVSYLGLRRLNSDRIEMTWPGNGVCQSNVSTLELTP